jgi:hypothetical protein
MCKHPNVLIIIRKISYNNVKITMGERGMGLTPCISISFHILLKSQIFHLDMFW